jgi:hypothetical protein
MAPHIEDDHYCPPHDNLEYKELLPAHIDDDILMQECKENNLTFANKEDVRLDVEEEYHSHVKMGLAPTDDKVHTAGGDDAQVKANELACIAHCAEYL